MLLFPPASRRGSALELTKRRISSEIETSSPPRLGNTQATQRREEDLIRGKRRRRFFERQSSVPKSIARLFVRTDGCDLVTHTWYETDRNANRKVMVSASDSSVRGNRGVRSGD